MHNAILAEAVYMFLGYVAYLLHMLAIAQFIYAIHRWGDNFQNGEKLRLRLKNLIHDRVELAYLSMSFSAITSLGFLFVLIPYYFDYSEFAVGGYSFTVALSHCMAGIGANLWNLSAIMGFRKRDRVGGWNEAKHRYHSAGV